MKKLGRPTEAKGPLVRVVTQTTEDQYEAIKRAACRETGGNISAWIRKQANHLMETEALTAAREELEVQS